MNGCAIQQNAFAAHDEMRGALVCPKPRRIGLLAGAPDPIRPLRWQSRQQVDPSDLRAGVELLDSFFLTKGEVHLVDSTPRFFCGSPPTRSTNPLINDARFGEAAPVIDLVPYPNPVSLAAPIPASASARTGCARTKFGFTPAAVRIEGFDCLDRGRSGSRGIPAVA